MSVFAEQLKKYRESVGLSQLALAGKLGVQQSTISRWERGIANPVGLYLTRLERLLKKGGGGKFL